MARPGIEPGLSALVARAQWTALLGWFFNCLCILYFANVRNATRKTLYYCF